MGRDNHILTFCFTSVLLSIAGKALTEAEVSCGRARKSTRYQHGHRSIVIRRVTDQMLLPVSLLETV